MNTKPYSVAGNWIHSQTDLGNVRIAEFPNPEIAAQFTHAANVLPGLVEALERLANQLEAQAARMFEPGQRNVTLGTLTALEDEARQALATATNVPTP
jgi:hypothetical protein